jgi:hypothetical protein
MIWIIHIFMMINWDKSGIKMEDLMFNEDYDNRMYMGGFSRMTNGGHFLVANRRFFNNFSKNLHQKASKFPGNFTPTIQQITIKQ